MKEKRDCKLVLDLLPNYIEKLTNEETNIFIEEHLKNCGECKTALESMEKDLKIETEKNNIKGLNFIKKYNIRLKFFKILATMFLLVVLIFIINIERKMVIVTSLINKSKEIDISNSYCRTAIFDNSDNRYRVSESYLKDNIGLSVLTLYSFNENLCFKQTDYYKDEENQFSLSESYEINGTNAFQPSVMPSSATVRPYDINLLGISLGIQNIEDYFDYVLNSSISKIKYKGKDCYLISNDFRECIIEKSTGLMLKNTCKIGIHTISYMDEEPVTTYPYKDITTYFDYSFGTVTDKDIEKPDISGYKKYGSDW